MQTFKVLIKKFDGYKKFFHNLIFDFCGNLRKQYMLGNLYICSN